MDEVMEYCHHILSKGKRNSLYAFTQLIGIFTTIGITRHIGC